MFNWKGEIRFITKFEPAGETLTPRKKFQRNHENWSSYYKSKMLLNISPESSLGVITDESNVTCKLV